MVRKSKKSLLKPEIYQTHVKDIKCTKLPEFIRAKKYLGGSFFVYFENNVVPDGAKVTISAGNYKNPNAELKNNECFVKNGKAEFTDLRFNGKSGRGTKFDVYIKVETSPHNLIITYPSAIKVTVDGPRPPRTKSKGPNDFIKNENLIKRNSNLISSLCSDSSDSPKHNFKKLKLNEYEHRIQQDLRQSSMFNSVTPTSSIYSCSNSSNHPSSVSSTSSSAPNSPSTSPLPIAPNTSTHTSKQFSPISANLQLLAETASTTIPSLENNYTSQDNGCIYDFNFSSGQNRYNCGLVKNDCKSLVEFNKLPVVNDSTSIVNSNVYYFNSVISNNIYKETAKNFLNYYLKCCNINLSLEALNSLSELIANNLTTSQNNHVKFDYQIFLSKLFEYFSTESKNVCINSRGCIN